MKKVELDAAKVQAKANDLAHVEFEMIEKLQATKKQQSLAFGQLKQVVEQGYSYYLNSFSQKRTLTERKNEGLVRAISPTQLQPIQEAPERSQR